MGDRRLFHKRPTSSSAPECFCARIGLRWGTRGLHRTWFPVVSKDWSRHEGLNEVALDGNTRSPTAAQADPFVVLSYGCGPRDVQGPRKAY